MRVAGPAYANNGAFLTALAREGIGIAYEPDFIVGAHALLQCNGLITRDAGFFRDYFKGLKVIVPKAA